MMELFLNIILSYNHNLLQHFTINISSVKNLMIMNNNNNLIK